MSSTYKLVCLNHDPAIVITDPGRPRDEIAADAIDRRGVEGHEQCDLLIVGYSGGLTEIGCTGAVSHCFHRIAIWVDASWLRLLHVAHAHDIGVSQLRLPGCWTRQRVLRLGALLGMDPVSTTYRLLGMPRPETTPPPA